MNDLDTLRPEVLAALNDIDRAFAEDVGYTSPTPVIRTELLRLAESNATLDQALSKHVFRCTELQLRAERAEAELAALKARIAGSTRAYHSSFEFTLDASTLYARATGVPVEETYALVKVEE